MAELVSTITVDVAGMDGLKAHVLGEMQKVLANAVREVAAKEQDGRVVARLFEVAGVISGSLGEAQAKVAVDAAPLAPGRWRGKEGTTGDEPR